MTSRLTVNESRTGYWMVQRDSVQLAGGPTRHAAERERELLEGLHHRASRRRRDLRPTWSTTPRRQARR
jgi:hypothetical protein